MPNKTQTKIIAEIGFNHLGSVISAKKMIHEAARAGADYAKLQTFIPSEMVRKDSKHYKYINKCELNIKDYQDLKKFAIKQKIKLISTAFDIESVKLLKKLKLSTIKVASMDIDNFYLFEEINKRNWEVILSTGMSSFEEIKNAYNFLSKSNKVTLLHCISKYPTKIEDTNLHLINKLKKISKGNIGFSDHTKGNEASQLSVIVYGCKFIEKHFTSDNKLPGADNKMSLNPKKFKKFVENIRNCEKIIYQKKKKIENRPDLINKKSFRRYLFYRHKIMAGTKLTKEKIICLRSNRNNLLPLRNYFKIKNKVVIKNVKKFQKISFKDLR